MKTNIAEMDVIDLVRQQWKREMAKLDTSPMETIGRVLRVQFFASASIARVLRQHGLDWGGFDVLATLRRSGSPYQMSPTQLYQELVLTSGAMTHRMDVLERAGLIKRKFDPSDRRGMLAVLTRDGRTLVGKVMAAHLKHEAKIAAFLSKTEQAQLARLLKKLLLGMENANDHDE